MRSTTLDAPGVGRPLRPRPRCDHWALSALSARVTAQIAAMERQVGTNSLAAFFSSEHPAPPQDSMAVTTPPEHVMRSSPRHSPDDGVLFAQGPLPATQPARLRPSSKTNSLQWSPDSHGVKVTISPSWHATVTSPWQNATTSAGHFCGYTQAPSEQVPVPKAQFRKSNHTQLHCVF